MKKLLTLSSLLLALPLVSTAQSADEETPVVYHKEPCEAFYKTPPLRDLLKLLPDIDEETYSMGWETKDKKSVALDLSELDDFGIPETGGIDPALQTNPAWRKESWLKVQWTGQGSGALPPDPTGAAGMNYYVQATNTVYRIWNKDGTSASSPKPLGTLWDGSSDGDPIVMYDRFAERWFISQFKISGNKILIAVSETSDPLGSYFTYVWSYSNFPDYPKFSVWSHSYFMTANMSSENCTAFEREKMLLGDPSASAIKMNLPAFVQFFRSTATTYAEGPTEPDMDEPAYLFAVQEDAWSGSISDDHIKVMKADIDWTAGTGSVSNHQLLYTDAFNCVFTTSWNDIAQKGTSQKLDAIAGIFSYKCQYRRFDGYNVVMLCNTVDVDNTNRGGIRWYELRDNNDGNWSIYQQGTWSPDTQNSRWLGNIAMDAQGNIGLAYSFAGPSNYCGIRYTGRFKDDPLGEMTVQEQVVKTGTGSQTVANRFGDYSQMTMDPEDDMTFWFTGEWISSGGISKTEVFSFSSWFFTETEENPSTAPYFNAYQPNPSELTLVWKNIKDENTTIEVYDMSGKLILAELANGTSNQENYSIPGNTSGVYLVKLSGTNTALSKKVYLAK